ncbi:MAG: hypothetical protein ACJ74R_01595 [Gaiellaceae bacterium]|jgi:hypothetical protein
MQEHAGSLELVQQLCCLECREPWLDPHERWRMYATHDDEPEVGLYCPACATREFDG